MAAAGLAHFKDPDGDVIDRAQGAERHSWVSFRALPAAVNGES